MTDLKQERILKRQLQKLNQMFYRYYYQQILICNKSDETQVPILHFNFSILRYYKMHFHKPIYFDNTSRSQQDNFAIINW